MPFLELGSLLLGAEHEVAGVGDDDGSAAAVDNSLCCHHVGSLVSVSRRSCIQLQTFDEYDRSLNCYKSDLHSNN